jgi:hypothetical protein
MDRGVPVTAAPHENEGVLLVGWIQRPKAVGAVPSPLRAFRRPVAVWVLWSYVNERLSGSGVVAAVAGRVGPGSDHRSRCPSVVTRWGPAVRVAPCPSLPQFRPPTTTSTRTTGTTRRLYPHVNGAHRIIDRPVTRVSAPPAGGVSTTVAIATLWLWVLGGTSRSGVISRPDALKVGDEVAGCQ